jgi:hypothetical protein
MYVIVLIPMPGKDFALQARNNFDNKLQKKCFFGAKSSVVPGTMDSVKSIWQLRCDIQVLWADYSSTPRFWGAREASGER